MNLIPLNDVVIIEKDIETERGGILVPESMKDPAGTDTGTVVSVNNSYLNGQGMRIHINGFVDAGSRVLYLRKHGIAVKGSKTQVCVRYENLLAVIEP